MTIRRQAAHKACRRAARESRLTGGTRTPGLVVTCGRCQDGEGRARFVERFRHDSLEARWIATAQTPEVPPTADGRPTAAPLGWDGFLDRFKYDPAVAQWMALAQTPEGHLTGEGWPADTFGWDKDRAVRSVWVLRCPRCGDRCPARDENLQAVAWRPVHGRTIDGRQLERITARLRPQLAEVGKRARVVDSAPLLDGLAGTPAVRELWQRLPLSRRRAVVALLLDTRVHRTRRGARTLDPQSVTLTWRTQ